jgi:hypothetical protein
MISALPIRQTESFMSLRRNCRLFQRNRSKADVTKSGVSSFAGSPALDCHKSRARLNNARSASVAEMLRIAFAAAASSAVFASACKYRNSIHSTGPRLVRKRYACPTVAITIGSPSTFILNEARNGVSQLDASIICVCTTAPINTKPALKWAAIGPDRRPRH